MLFTETSTIESSLGAKLLTHQCGSQVHAHTMICFQGPEESEWGRAGMDVRALVSVHTAGSQVGYAIGVMDSGGTRQLSE